MTWPRVAQIVGSRTYKQGVQKKKKKQGGQSFFFIIILLFCYQFNENFMVIMITIIIFHLSIVDIKCYISFRCTTQKFRNPIHYTMLTTSITTICPHILLLQYHITYAMTFILVTYSFHNWKLLFPTHLHPFCPFPQSLLLWKPSGCSLYL